MLTALMMEMVSRVPLDVNGKYGYTIEDDDGNGSGMLM
jgi:hypothetical protein